MAYNAYIVPLKNIREHPDADKINLATCFGNQIVVGKEVEEGTLGVYFPSDGQLSQDFLHNNNLFRHSDLNKDKEKFGFFDDNRRIRVQKFRGEKSDGIWLPISCLDYLGNHGLQKKEAFNSYGSKVICEKYVAPVNKRTQGSGKKSERRTRRSFPIFKEHTDTLQFAYNSFKIRKNMIITFSEKVHGTSGRTANTIVKRHYLIERFLGKYLNKKWDYVCGSRRVIIDFNKKDTGFYGSNEFRRPHHDQFVGNLRKGETVFYEIVGWVNDDKPIMSICDNKKTKDKEFIKKYGDRTVFNYGCLPGQSKIYVYRITVTNEDGQITELSSSAMRARCRELGVNHVPKLKTIVYDGELKELKELVKDLCEGESTLDATHLREGVVLHIEHGQSFWGLKHKSFTFKVLEGIIKEANVEDIEEAQG